MRASLLLVFLLASALSCSAGTISGFTAGYGFPNWALTNTSADGSAALSGPNVVITGGNTGSGAPGTTDFTIAAPEAGIVAFSFAYFSFDVPTVDYAGYLVGPNFFPLADTSGQSDSRQFPVIAGQTFGFRIGTVDNEFEPGILTISNFQGPGEVAVVPEPNTAPFVLALILLALGIFPARIRKGWKAAAVRIGSRACVCILLVAAAHFPLSAQMHFNGTAVTDQVVLTTQVNVKQVSSGIGTSGTPKAITRGLEARVNRRMVPKFGFRPAILEAGESRRATLTSPLALTVTTSNATHFDGISHFQMRNADHGNQFSIEPPSPGIASANGFVIEVVSNAFQVYNLSGVPQLPNVLTTNQLFGLPPDIDRTTNTYGAYPTDGRAFWDPDIRRWFVLQRFVANDAQGDILPQSQLYIAVSQTDDPTGTYNIYVRDTTNALHSGCPCYGDYPQIGADKSGFYISANEFNFIGEFLDVSILAISKASLAANAAKPTAFEFLIPFTGYEFTIFPATTPIGGQPLQQNGGVEYFVSSAMGSGSALAVYAMSNTASLASSSPQLSLIEVTTPTLSYSTPPLASQPLGVIPYGQSVGASVPPPLDGGDTRVQSVVYVGSRLYVTLATQVTDAQMNSRAGAAYVVISVAYRGGTITAAALRQGYLMVDGNHVLRPAISVDASGNGAIVFTLVGPQYYPSAAFVSFSAFTANATVKVAAAGGAPEDGFTGYEFPFIARWGDYSAAVMGEDGRIWLAAEYIPGGPRTDLATDFANWGTALIAVAPQ